MKRLLGFTLIELMITLAIAAILLAIAVPAFFDQLRASRRSEAFQILGDAQLKLEKWRSNHATYTTTLTDLSLVSPTSSGYYTLAIAAPAPDGPNCTETNANSFAVTATKAGGQADDSACATIVLTNRCGTISKTSTGGGTCWK